ncbi:MAG: UDP-N-acetylmuramoyl-tripeptide--D-alanyl-D-alanine ligase [Bacteroidota bacterium]|nr:UDP-N-acetylmuramoyl-tripeptide--D-alanyl-D-alanine ligase [Candidatus Kapabacteria bacterium]MDW8219089.1 UDP-N-acetylmuramoyl-tripeptide--D-alanyl-D-alanine ligase [Bacteroidota bacterium]
MSTVPSSNAAPFTYNDLVNIFGASACASLSREFQCVGISTDTRTLEPGNLFVALQGQRFDGHTHVQEALQKGAAGAIIENHAWTGIMDSSAPLILVPSTLQALGMLGNTHRRRFSLPVIAVAGSAGKTTTKDIAAWVLSARHVVLKTEENFNNRIGVPLTLLQLTSEHTAAVIEIGTNAVGEIGTLAHIVAPTHGIITTIGKEHLENLLSEDGVEEEETALLRYLEQHGGTALINMNDERLQRYCNPGWIQYGLVEQSPTFDVSAYYTVHHTYSLLHIVYRDSNTMSCTARLPHVGIIGMRNALAAAAIGFALGLDSETICQRLESFQPKTSPEGYGRMVIEHCTFSGNRSITLINDCYNANPTSMHAALDTLRDYHAVRKLALLGDMLELGSSSAYEHDTLLELLNSAEWLYVGILTGEEMQAAYTRHMKYCTSTSKLLYASSILEAVQMLSACLHTGDVLLVKGSRALRLERAIALLRTPAGVT